MAVVEFGAAAQGSSVYTSPKRKLWLTSFSDTLQRLSAVVLEGPDKPFSLNFRNNPRFSVILLIIRAYFRLFLIISRL